MVGVSKIFIARFHISEPLKIKSALDIFGNRISVLLLRFEILSSLLKTMGCW